MTIEITRRAALSGSLGKVKLKLNGSTVLKIKNGKTETIKLYRRDSVLQVKEFGSWSNKLTVNKGDRVEITKKSWDFWYHFFISGFFVIYMWFSPVAIWILFVLVILVSSIPYFLFPTYELSKIEKSD